MRRAAMDVSGGFAFFSRHYRIEADLSEPRLPDALASIGFGDWTLTNV